VRTSAQGSALRSMEAATLTGGASTVANPLSDIVQGRRDTGIDPPHAPAMPNM
jgi:hypothetical protein